MNIKILFSFFIFSYFAIHIVFAQDSNSSKALQYYNLALDTHKETLSLSEVIQAQKGLYKQFSHLYFSEESCINIPYSEDHIVFAKKRKQLANAWRLLQGLPELQERILNRSSTWTYLAVRRNSSVVIPNVANAITKLNSCYPSSGGCNLDVSQTDEIVLDWSSSTNPTQNWVDLLTEAENNDWYGDYGVDFVLGFTDIIFTGGVVGVSSVNTCEPTPNPLISHGIAIRGQGVGGISNNGLEAVLAHELCHLRGGVHDAVTNSLMLPSVPISANTMGVPNQNCMRTSAGCLALPLTLLSFSVHSNNEKAILNWQTSNEIGRDKMILYKSNDGEHWEKIYQTTSLGIADGSSYSFTDSYLSSDIAYYKLEINWESWVRSVNMSKPADYQIYPNPSNGKVTVINPTPTSILVFDVFGRLIQSFDSQNEQVHIDLLQGVYIFQIGDKYERVIVW